MKKSKILMILLSAGISVLLWLYVVTVVSPNSDKYIYNVPVKIQGAFMLEQQERPLMITSGELPSVTLHLEGNRRDLNKIDSSLVDIYVDVSGLTEPGTHSLGLTDPSFRTDVANSAITVASKDPATVLITVEEKESKPVDVDVQWIGEQHRDYTVDKDNKELSHKQVNITGPKSVISQITMARIYVDIQDRTESISGNYQYTLCNEKGEPVDAQMVVADVESIHLGLKILRTKTVKLEVDWIAGGGVKPEDCVIKYEPETIDISGSDALVKDRLTWSLGQINLGEITESTTLTLPIVMEDGIFCDSGETTAKVTITLPKLETREMTVTNIAVVNKAEGLDAVVKTKQLKLMLRGSKKQLEAVRPEDITVTVDLLNEQTGQHKKNAIVTVGVDGVGVVGPADDYTVTVELKKVQ